MPANNVSYKQLAGIKTKKTKKSSSSGKTKSDEIPLSSTNVDELPSPSMIAVENALTSIDEALSNTVVEEVTTPTKKTECGSCNVLAGLVRTLLDRQKALEGDMAELKTKLQSEEGSHQSIGESASTVLLERIEAVE